MLPLHRLHPDRRSGARSARPWCSPKFARSLTPLSQRRSPVWPQTTFGPCASRSAGSPPRNECPRGSGGYIPPPPPPPPSPPPCSGAFRSWSAGEKGHSGAPAGSVVPWAHPASANRTKSAPSHLCQCISGEPAPRHQQARLASRSAPRVIRDHRASSLAPAIPLIRSLRRRGRGWTARSSGRAPWRF